MKKYANTKASDEEVIRRIGEYDKEYGHIEKDLLVVYAVDYLKHNNIEATFDKVVVATYRLFPKAFGLIGFPEYPDGRTIYYSVFNHCVLTKKWLGGNIKSGFFVTEKGKYILDGMFKHVPSKQADEIKHYSAPNRKEVHYLTKLKESKAYSNFIKKREILDIELRNAFDLTSTASANILASKLDLYELYAKRLKDKKMLDFIVAVRTKIKVSQ